MCDVFNINYECGKKMTEEHIKEIYTDPGNPASYSSVYGVYKEAKAKGVPGVTLKKVKEVLHSLPAYTFNYERKWRFPRRKVIAFEIDQIWTIDLVFFDELSRWNHGYKYCLTVIDILSGYNWVQPVKNKHVKLVRDAFALILERAMPRKPKKVFSDYGMEFLGASFAALLEEHEIAWYGTHNYDIKSSIVERFNKTFKNRVWKYMTHMRQWNWIDAVQKISASLNNTKTRSHGMTPATASTLENAELFERKYAKGNNHQNRKRSFKFNPGDFVRIAKPRTTFARGFKPTFSAAVYQIKQKYQTEPHVYKVQTAVPPIIEIEKAFYSPELVKVTDFDPSDPLPRAPPKKRCIT